MQTIGEKPLTRKEISARYYQKNKEQLIQKSKAWSDANPEKVKARSRAYYKDNLEKVKESNRAWALANPEKVKAKDKAWAVANPEKVKARNRKRRALKRGNEHSPYTEKQCLEFWGSVCYLCNKEIDLKAPRNIGKPGWRNGLHFDHVVPLSKGGPDTINNVRPSHGGCNTTKHVKETVA